MTFPVVSLCKKGFSTKEFDQNKIQSTKFCWGKKIQTETIFQKRIGKKKFWSETIFVKKEIERFLKTRFGRNNFGPKQFGAKKFWYQRNLVEKLKSKRKYWSKKIQVGNKLIVRKKYCLLFWPKRNYVRKKFDQIFFGDFE